MIKRRTTRESREALSSDSPVAIIGGMASSGSLFTRPLITSQIDGDSFVLFQPFDFELAGISDVKRSLIQVPAGFVSDGASVPKILTPMYPRYGKWLAAAVLHDWLYWSKLTNRKQADEIFHCAMLVTGVDPIIAQVFYRSVRLFGNFSWRKNGANRKSNPRHRLLDITREDWWKPYLGNPVIAKGSST